MVKPDTDAALDDALMQTFPASDPFSISPESQSDRIVAMHPTKNDLPAKTREAAVELLQASLADAIDLATQAKQAHWNVKGSNFIALHELFDRIYDNIETYTDMIAKRLVALGGYAYGTAREAVRRSTISEYPIEFTASADHLDTLSTALAQFGKVTRSAIDSAVELGDQDTANLFTEISRGIDKNLWLVETHRG